MNREGKFRINLSGLLTPALVGTAIEEESLTARCNFVHRTGDCLGGTPKGDLHISRMAQGMNPVGSTSCAIQERRLTSAAVTAARPAGIGATTCTAGRWSRSRR